MTNTKVSNNNPDKESIINKSITKSKDNEIIKNENKVSRNHLSSPVCISHDFLIMSLMVSASFSSLGIKNGGSFHSLG